MSLLTTNTKLKKSLKDGYKSFGIHLAPHKLSGKNVCPSASKGCAAACLFNAGYGAYNMTKTARINKTVRFWENKNLFLQTLIQEVQTQVRRCGKNGYTPTFRLNLTSDLPWESMKIDGKNIMQMFPAVQFYDYCKNMKRMLRFLTGKLPKNYHLTFSRSEKNQSDCDIVAGCGGNVAAVFLDKLPTTYMGRPVINGDINDLRFLDKKNVIVGLIAKGRKAKEDETGFVIKH